MMAIICEPRMAGKFHCKFILSKLKTEIHHDYQQHFIGL